MAGGGPIVSEGGPIGATGGGVRLRPCNGGISNTLLTLCSQKKKMICLYLRWARTPEGVRRAGSPEGRVGGEADCGGLAARVGVGGARGTGVHRAGGAWID